MRRILRGAIVAAVAAITGCSAVTRHEIVSTIFDGVPSLPPPQQICEEYAAREVAKVRAQAEGVEKSPSGDTAAMASQHRPYADKTCDKCHDKSAESGFVVANKKDLCYVCHKDFIKGQLVHGPVAVRECLACHDPHTSTNASLLKTRAAEICGTCHKEGRQAQSLHKLVAARGIICVNCHDPHSGNVRFFLK